MEALIKIQNLSAGYEKNAVLEDVNLDIFENDFIGIVGPNGGGKTTLLKVILGLIKPLRGTIQFNQRLNTDQNFIGYLPQTKHIDKKFPITVSEVVRSGLMTNGPSKLSRIDIKIRIENILQKTGVLSVKNKAIGELSGGQAQRVFLCRAIINNPKILLLDEPDTFIDNRFGTELYDMISELNERMAVLFVSHDLGTVSSRVKTIACVNRKLYYHPNNHTSLEKIHHYIFPAEPNPDAGGQFENLKPFR